MKIRELIFALAVAAMTGACTSRAATPYNFDGNIGTEYNGMTAYLLDYDTGEHMDSALVTNGHVTMVGNIEKPVLARLIIDGKRAGVVVLEPGSISYDVRKQTATGTPLNETLMNLGSELSQIEKQYEAAPADSTGDASRHALIARYAEVCDSAMKANKENPVGYYIFLQQAYELSLPELQSMLKAYPQFGEYKRVGALLKDLESAAATAEGAQYKDFTIAYNDSTYRLSDYVGKDGAYTLVDFWASWCGPCIKETRTIKRLYEKYHGKGLNVVGVAVWDEPENTLRAIQTHKLPWDQIIGADHIPTDIYGISGIPCILLIDPNGKIVSRNKQGQDLIADVEAAMEQLNASEEQTEE